MEEEDDRVKIFPTNRAAFASDSDKTEPDDQADDHVRYHSPAEVRRNKGCIGCGGAGAVLALLTLATVLALAL